MLLFIFKCVLSRNNALSITHIISVKQQSLMKKLNTKKIKWIVKEGDKEEQGFWTIAHAQHTSPQHARKVYKNTKKSKSQDFLLVEENLMRQPATKESL